MKHGARLLGVCLLGSVLGAGQACSSMTTAGDAGDAPDRSAAMPDAGSTSSPAPETSDAASNDTADAMPASSTPTLANELVHGDAFTGGTRLRAVLAEASDGSAIFLHWWDTQLGESCQFEALDEPEANLRCLPRAAWTIYEGIEEAFADASCSQPLLQGKAPASGVVRRIDTRCWDARDYFRVGARFAGASIYRKSDTGCAPQPSGSAELHVLTPMPWTAFVSARVMAASADQVATARLVADDGSHAPSGFFDRDAGFSCWPRPTKEGMRCLPTSFGWGDRGGKYADARCSEAVAVPDLGCGTRNSALPFVLFAEPISNGVIAAVHRGGERLAQVFERIGTDGCRAEETESAAFAVGAAIPLGDFSPASLTPVTLPSGLVQTRAQLPGSAGDSEARTVARFEQLASSALGGYECVLAVTPDEVVRCVPRLQIITTQYADTRCTEPVWQTESTLISVQPGEDAMVEIAAGTAGRLPLPRVDHVMTGGVPHTSAVYARTGADCSLVPNVPNARQLYHRFSGEARLADLPALPIVVR